MNQLRICVEKPLPHEEQYITNLKNISENEDHLKILKAAFYTSKQWKNGSVIKIQFLEDGSGIQKTPISLLKQSKGSKMDPIEYEIENMNSIDAVKHVVTKRIIPTNGLKFQFVEMNGDVRIGFDPSEGAWSLIGTDCLQSSDKTMNFGWLDSATIMHEFGHVLGMIHEHQNPRGQTIDWNDEAVYQWAAQTQGWDRATTYSNILEKYTVDQTNGSTFDPKSIMLYFFPASLTLNNKGTQQNLRLSSTDVKYINASYPGGNPSKIVEVSNGYNSIMILIIIAIIVVIAILMLMKNRRKADFFPTQ